MKNDRYVLLTGGKNNAGDYLIKYRAKALLEKHRSDRSLIDFDAWQPFSEEKLQIVNSSKALLLTGGPALQKNMYPNIYPMIDDLSRIEVPIITMGIGWKSSLGSWSDTYRYSLSSKTHELLERINNSGFFSSVRDYHTLNVLIQNGYKNFIMTGCPALYALDQIENTFTTQTEINKIAFSLGVSISKEEESAEKVKEFILYLVDKFDSSDFEVVFHHSIDPSYLETHNPNVALYRKHREFVQWLKDQEIGYVDISGSAENLINYYSSVDLHIGYRVHAHIFMNSIKKPSILIAEDGRGTGVNKVLNGFVVNHYNKKRWEQTGRLYTLLKKIREVVYRKPKVSKVNEKLIEDISSNLSYEMEHSYPRINTNDSIKKHYLIMKKFLRQLP